MDPIHEALIDVYRPIVKPQAHPNPDLPMAPHEQLSDAIMTLAEEWKGRRLGGTQLCELVERVNRYGEGVVARCMKRHLNGGTALGRWSYLDEILRNDGRDNRGVRPGTVDGVNVLDIIADADKGEEAMTHDEISAAIAEARQCAAFGACEKTGIYVLLRQLADALEETQRKLEATKGLLYPSLDAVAHQRDRLIVENADLKRHRDEALADRDAALANADALREKTLALGKVRYKLSKSEEERIDLKRRLEETQQELKDTGAQLVDEMRARDALSRRLEEAEKHARAEERAIENTREWVADGLPDEFRSEGEVRE